MGVAVQVQQCFMINSRELLDVQGVFSSAFKLSTKVNFSCFFQFTAELP